MDAETIEALSGLLGIVGIFTFICIIAWRA